MMTEMAADETEQLSHVDLIWQKAFGGRHTLNAFKSHVVPLVLSVCVWWTYSRYLTDLSCQFKDVFWLRLLWPPNELYVGQLAASQYSASELCWLFAVTSTAGAIWLCWLVWRVGFEIFRRDLTFIPNATRLFLQRAATLQFVFAIATLVLAFLCLQGFHSGARLYGLSVQSSVGANVFKIVFLFQLFLFYVLGLLIEVTSLFIWFVFLASRNRWQRGSTPKL